MRTTWYPVPTPSSNQLTEPTEGEIAVLKTGPNRFPNIGDFKAYPTRTGVNETRYNCFAWSLGFQDRWCDGGTREETLKLYAHYYYVACTTDEAEVDVYDIPDAPAVLTTVIPAVIDRRTGKERRPEQHRTHPNKLAVALHAHRVDDPGRDLCSSKFSRVLQHGRLALEDTRPWGSRNPPITFGTIYGHFKKHPEHPSFPGKEKNRLPSPPPHPQDPRNANPAAPAYPSGSAPIGHPHSSLSPPIEVRSHPPCTLHILRMGAVGLRGGAGDKHDLASFVGKSVRAIKPANRAAPHDQDLKKKATTSVSSSRPSSSVSNQPTSSSARPPSSSGPKASASQDQVLKKKAAVAASSSRPSSSSSNQPSSLSSRPSSASSIRPPSSSSQASTSSKGYGRVPHMEPYAKIPDSKGAAVKSAKVLYESIKASASDLVKNFAQKYDAWRKNWFKDESPNSESRATGPEFQVLYDMGPKIIPLVVYMLTSESEFMAVVLYDKLEQDPLYKVDPKDYLNYKVLQRRAHLILAAKEIIELNYDRNLAVSDALDKWKELRTERQVYSNSNLFTDGPGYDTLAQMGPSITSHVMLKYYEEDGGWYHELLHVLVHGEGSGAGLFFKDVLFASWKDWFEHKDHKDAPKGLDDRAQFGHGYREDDLRRNEGE